METDPYPVGGYYGGNFYNGGSYRVGTATSPELATGAFTEAIVSWNADTLAGSWVEARLRIRFGARWSKWYNMGVWASATDTVQRHSVSLQGDTDGYVAVDTFVLADKVAAPDGLQVQVRLFSAGSAVPDIRNVSVATSPAALKKPPVSAGNPALWGSLLAVPECSQMIYPDGGNVWCSPTSVSMVLGYWGDDRACEPRVRSAVEGVFDWRYDGHGNWPFNTAYAASSLPGGHAMEAYVARFGSLAEAEPWVAAGIPVVVSLAWKGDLTGAPIKSSSGHLMALVGFDPSGNPILNDPAAASNEDVQRTYQRSEFEPLWLHHSGGTVYLIYPEGMVTPGL